MLDSKSPSASPLAQPPTASPSKRKRDEAPDKSSTNPIKRKKPNKAGKDDDADLDLDAGVNDAFGRMDGRLLADFVAQCTKRFEGDLSVVELEDKHIPEKAFRDTTTWQKQRNLPNLPTFLDHFANVSKPAAKLSTAPKAKGTPHTLVVTGAGLRAAHLTRALRKFQTRDAVVGKLFAKHIKLKEAEEFVKKTRIGIGVGTPTRLSDLLDSDSLSLEKLRRVVIDASHVDQKKRSIFDMRETLKPLLALLNRPDLKPRFTDAEKPVDLLLY